MADTASLQQKLRDEMSSRVLGDQTSPPERWGPWLYHARIPEGREYPVYFRRRHSVKDQSGLRNLRSKLNKFLPWDNRVLHEDQQLLDLNEIAKEHGHVHLGMCKMSRDHCLLAYTTDLSGKELFTLFVKNVDTGLLLLKPRIEGVVSVEWARDNCTLLYTIADEMLRPFRVFKHKLGSGEKDILLFEEKDPGNYVDISRTKDWQYMTINVNSKTSSEVYLLDAGSPGGSLELVEKRKAGVEYFVEHHRGCLVLLTNAPMHFSNTPNEKCDYRVFLCPVGMLSFNYWKQIDLEGPDTVTYDMDIFDKHLVLYQRKDGLPQICVLDMPILTDLVKEQPKILCPFILPLPKGVCTITPGLNQDFYSSTLRLSVSSPIMPEATLDYDLSSKDYVVLHQEMIRANHDRDLSNGGFVEKRNGWKFWMTENTSSYKSAFEGNQKTASSEACKCVSDLSAFYVCDHLKVKSADKVDVPLTIVHSCKIKLDGTNPTLLIGYGAYGEVLDLKCCSDLFSLLDRGWVVAFAHVRGGGELGKSWHHSGNLLTKLNSISDFLSCADFLVNNFYGHRSCLIAKGTSAGGLLVAASTNARPDLFRAIVLKVPFIDICNNMLDESLPLTVPDYEEWGNPTSEKVFHYIRSYSPYDNVRKGASYPGMLVLSSFLDTRVGYWEAAKWVALIREERACLADLPILLKTDMNSGHFGEGGRYQHTNDSALEYAFLLKVVKLTNVNRDVK